MNRERWTSFPAATAEERALLRAVDGVSARRTVIAIGPDGRKLPLEASFSIRSDEPFDGKADVVARLSFEGDAPCEGMRLADDPWELLDRFLRDAAEEARRTAATAR